MSKKNKESIEIRRKILKEMEKQIPKDKCFCGRKLLLSEDGKSFYCPECKEHFINSDFDEIQDAERKFGA